MQATYLIGSLIAFVIWLVLFLFRKDTRKEMIVLSLLMMIFGAIMETFVWTKDWWRPVTITGTLLGPEDFIFGFSMGGICSVIYEELFRKTHAERRNRTEHRHHARLIAFIVGLIVIVGCFSAFVLRLNSAESWTLSTIVAITAIWIVRRDLIIPSLLTGAIITSFAFLGFFILNLIQPNFVYHWWLLKDLTGVVILGVPSEDIIWFFTMGAFIGPIYELWQGTRLRNI